MLRLSDFIAKYNPPKNLTEAEMVEFNKLNNMIKFFDKVDEEANEILTEKERNFLIDQRKECIELRNKLMNK